MKKKINRELALFVDELGEKYKLKAISPLIFSKIKQFILRDGKRIRPLLLISAYLGYASKEASGLYRAAVSAEILHDFMLIHDDIIDKSEKRRGKPSMHAMFNNYLSNFKNRKFSGEDLSIAVGDILYAASINVFLTIKVDSRLKEKALKILVDAAFYTGLGECLELLQGLKDIASFTKEDIYRIYDFKTAIYTFAAPLAVGAILAGADKNQADEIYDFGIFLGRAFQIKDDIIGMFSKEEVIGKPILNDLQESKKTLLVWYAYNKSAAGDKIWIRRVLGKKNVMISDLKHMRGIMSDCGCLDYARREIAILLAKADEIAQSIKISPEYKQLLKAFSSEILAF